MEAEIRHLLSSLPFCLICKQQIHVLDWPLLAPCGHIFCKKCVKSKRFQRSVTCPMDHVKVKITQLTESQDILDVNRILKSILEEYSRAAPDERPALAGSVQSLVDNMHKTFALRSVEIRQNWKSPDASPMPTPPENTNIVKKMYAKFSQRSAIAAPRRAPSMTSNELLHTVQGQQRGKGKDKCEECKTLVATVTCLCVAPFPRLCEKCSIKHYKYKPGVHSIEPLTVFSLIGSSNDLSLYNTRKASIAAIKIALQMNLDKVEHCKSQVEGEYQRLLTALEQWRITSLNQLKSAYDRLEEAFHPVFRELTAKQYDKELSGQTILDQLLSLTPDEIETRINDMKLFSYDLNPNLEFSQVLKVKLADEKIAAISRPLPKQLPGASLHEAMLGESKEAQVISGELPVSITPDVRAIESRLGGFEYGQGESGVRKGPMRLSNGAVYIGEWNAEGRRHGKGMQIMADGSKFEGWWKEDKADGLGRLITTVGDVYVGMWKNSMANGFGSLFIQDGTSYEGHWKDDRQDGQGLEIWPDGTTFQGAYIQGKKNGQGRYEYENGNVYEGSFEDDAICGYGVYRWVDGRSYAGQWKDSMLHGFGEFRWPDGKIYVGNYVCDKKHGHGELTHPDGRKYAGNWQNGLQHGAGAVTQQGKSRTAVWTEGHCS